MDQTALSLNLFGWFSAMSAMWASDVVYVAFTGTGKNNIENEWWTEHHIECH